MSTATAEIMHDPQTANDAQAVAARRRGRRLPWTFRYPWVCVGLVPLTGAPICVFNGMMLALWLRRDRVLTWSLATNTGLIGVAATLGLYPWLPADKHVPLSLCLVALWFISAFRLRAEVLAYYSRRDGMRLYLRPSFTALLSGSYINFVVARYEQRLRRGEPVIVHA